MSDRKSSILTDTQREYLQGERDKPPSNEPQFKGRIRERVEEGLFDFHLLFEYLSQEEAGKIFGSEFAPQVTKPEEVQDGIPDSPPTPHYVQFAIAFFLRGLNYSDEPFYPKLSEYDEPQPAFRYFTQEIERGIERYLSEEKSYLANATVEISFDDIDHTEEMFQEAEDDNDQSD